MNNTITPNKVNSSKQNEQTRVKWIDTAKGIGIILVMWGHIGLNNGPISPWQSSFNMPLFFFLSGFVFSAKGKFKDFFIKKFRAIIINYFLLAIPIVIFNVAFSMFQHRFDIEEFVTMIKRILIQDRYLVLWFLACLFWLNLFLYILVKLTNNSLITIAVVVIVFAVLGVCYYTILGGRALPWDIDAVTTSMPFFFGGYLVKEVLGKDYYIKEKKTKLIVFCLCFTLNAVLTCISMSITGEWFNINNCTYGVPLLTFPAAFAGIIAAIMFSMSFTPRLINYIGRYSLIYFAWHFHIMVHITNRVLKGIGLVYNDFWPYHLRMLFWALDIFLVIIGLTICNELILRIKGLIKTKNN